MSESAALAAKLGAEGKKVADFMAALDSAQWQVEVYTEGSTWTVRNLFGHLLTSENAFLRLFADIRDGGLGVSEDFVIDRYNASQQRKTELFTPKQLLEMYIAARAQMVTLVSELSDADLDKRGRHPYLGLTPLREMVKMIYIHNQLHFRDARRALKV